MNKKVIGWLLCLAMVLAMLPTFSLAADSEFVIDENGVLTKYNGPGGDVVIPEGVVNIGRNAFAYCQDVTEVKLPDSLIIIGDYAFRGIPNLTEVTIPKNVENIGVGVFEECSALTRIELSDSLYDIGNGAFRGCTSLTDITLPDRMTQIRSGLFYGCTGLKNVNFGSGITVIGSNAFYGCTGLTDLEIPETVTTISDRAYAFCNGLTSVTIPRSVRALQVEVFMHCENLARVRIFGNTSVGWNAFLGCSALTDLYLGTSVSTIDNWAFFDCGSLTKVVIPPNVSVIGLHALGYQEDLENATELPMENFTICGYPGSAAEAYANENGFQFVPMENQQFMVFVDAVPATCNAPGVVAYWTDGAHYYSDAYGEHEITHENLTIPALGHDWSEWTEACPASETEEGVLERECARCGKQELWTLAPTGTTCSLACFMPHHSYKNQFQDVISGSWYYSSVAKAYELGLVKGVSATSYNRKGDVKIGETIALACRIHSIYMGDGETFAVAEGEKWYDPYVRYAIENGIISAGEYEVYNVPATREQFAAILAKALPAEELQAINNVPDNAIPDVTMTNPHAEDIYLLYRAGVLKGNDGYGTFTPDNPIQRSEVAAIIVRMAIPAEREEIHLS